MRTIQAVAAGEALFGPAIARRLTTFSSAPRPQAAIPFPELTEREHEDDQRNPPWLRIGAGDGI
ncbi:MAG: hypothetical protein QN129_10360 [Armatimonadota bacterium]|nr:hypothetical protein [Armatimonadota bacterium]